MIHGIGIDIIKVERMKAAVERWGEKFLKRVFTESEIAYASKKKDPYLSLAVRFAAKEALIKALGLTETVSLADIEVESSAHGRPSIKVNGRLAELFSRNSFQCAHVSLSHEREYGVACVVVEK